MANNVYSLYARDKVALEFLVFVVFYLRDKHPTAYFCLMIKVASYKVFTKIIVELLLTSELSNK